MTKRKNNSQYNKTWVSWFIKNKTKESYDKILKDNFKNHKRCKYCDGPIYYYDSTFSVTREYNLVPLKKSYLSTKTIYDKDYYLCVCEDCLTKEFPEYQEMNKSRVFNKMNDITEYAFDIPKEIGKKYKDENYRVTKDNFIKKYGENDGLEKWDSYVSKQSYTNSFEYKNKTHNWTIDNFNDYNKSRSITLSNLIDRHGEDDGVKIWDEYINKQKETKSKEYVINKYGLEYWITLCKNKKVTLDHFIKKYGKEKGEELYINKIHNNIYLPSKISGEVFEDFEGTKIKIKMRPHEIIIAFLFLWFGIAFLCCLGSIYAMFTRDFNLVFLGPFFMILFGIVLLSVGFKTETNKSKQDFKKILNAEII